LPTFIKGTPFAESAGDRIALTAVPDPGGEKAPDPGKAETGLARRSRVFFSEKGLNHGIEL
jgi:hypothetical protein